MAGKSTDKRNKKKEKRNKKKRKKHQNISRNEICEGEAGPFDHTYITTFKRDHCVCLISFLTFLSISGLSIQAGVLCPPYWSVTVVCSSASLSAITSITNHLSDQCVCARVCLFCSLRGYFTTPEEDLLR